MIIKNGLIYGEDLKFHEGEVVIENGIIADTKCAACGEGAVCGDKNCGEEVIDAEGGYVIPGLLDLHFHGALGADVCDGNREVYETIAQFELSQGVTQICPATLTLAVEDLENVLAIGASFAKDQKKTNIEARVLSAEGKADEAKELSAKNGADLLGFNMEGPFISKSKKGAQNEKYILPCSAEIAQRFLDASEGLVKIIGLAPEENKDTFEAYIDAVKDKVKVSLAHTGADYDISMKAFAKGACHGVHLYNAMTPLTHRAPGVVGAIMDSKNVMAEIICDGVHVHPSAVRAAFAGIGKDRMILISDSLRAAGMEDGIYELGGQEMQKVGPVCTLTENGTIAGSVSSLMQCMVNAVKTMEMPLETAVECAAVNPAKCIGVFGEYGSIAPGKHGNVVILNKDLEIKAVIKDGIRVR